MGRLISAVILREMAKTDKNILLEEEGILTPSAIDLAKELGITITKGRQEIVSHKVVGQSAGNLVKQRTDLLDRRVTHVKGESVVIQPFHEAPQGQKIGMVDVISAREANLCCGFMTFDHARLPWYLNYDEADYVIEGDFVLEVEGQAFRAKAGDVIYIPKGSNVVFSSPTFCKVFYTTYPANWSDFCK